MNDQIKFGDIVITTATQNDMRDIPYIQVGTRCSVIKVVDMPGYDLLVVPEGYVMKVRDEYLNEQDYYSVLLYRGTWKKEK